MELKTQQVTYVWYIDLENYLEEKMGQRPDFQEQEWGQDTLRILHVGELTEDDRAEVEWFGGNAEERMNDWLAHGGSDITAQEVLCIAYRKGYLPEGDLYVHIWW